MKEFDKPADRLIEAIKQWSERMDGVVLTPKEILKRATEVLKERLK